MGTLSKLGKNSGTLAVVCLFISVTVNVILTYQLSRERSQLGGGQSKSQSQTFSTGERASTIALVATDGSRSNYEFNNAALPTLIYWFRPSCVWCEANLPNSEALARQAGGRYRFLAVSDASPAELTRYAKSYHVTYPLFSMTPVSVARYHFEATPASLLVSALGLTVKGWTGAYVPTVLVDLETALGIKTAGSAYVGSTVTWLMIPIRIVWVVLGGWVAISYADSGSAQRAQDIQKAISLSRSAAPEFGSDALLTLVEGRLVTDQPSQRTILEKAFELGAGAQEVAALAVVEPPTSALTHALALPAARGLDGVSLRVRAVWGLLKIDPRRARQLFEGIKLPPATSFRCNTRFVYDFRLYFEVMGDLADAMPDSGERGRFLARQASRLNSGSEIAPFVNAVTKRMSRISSADLAVIARSVADRLPNLVQDSRTYSWSIRADAQSVSMLAKALPTDAREYLMRGLRSWVVRGIEAGICLRAPNSTAGNPPHGSPLSPAAEFNRQVALLNVSEVPAIPDRGHIRDAGEFAAPDAFLPDQNRYSRVERQLHLDSPRVTSQAEISRWRNELGNYLSMLAQWKVTGTARDEFYLEKSDLLERAIGLQETAFPGEIAKPEGPDATRLLVEFLDGDVAEAVYRNRHLVWYAPVMFALGSAEHTRAMDEALLRSRSPDLRLYGLIGRLLAGAGEVYY